MDSHSLSLSFELKIIRARNIYLKSSKDLFVRCYLPAAGSCNKRVRLESQQISSSNSNLTWNQTLSLNCSSLDENSLKSLKQGTIILELRSRKCTSFMARMSGSKLIATAEIPWNDTKNMEVEKWAVLMIANNKKKTSHVYNDDVKPPALQIAIKVINEETTIEVGKKKVFETRWDECGCMGECNSCVDYDYFLH